MNQGIKRRGAKLCLLALLILGVSSSQSGLASSKALTESSVGKRIVQRLNQFVGKHIDLKKPAVLAMTLWMLNSAPVHAEPNPLNFHAAERTHAIQQSVGDTQESLANIDADWELLKPKPRGKRDFTYSFNYLLLEAGNFWRVMNLSYLGESASEGHLFLGARAFIVMNKEVILDQTVNSLIGRAGPIKENLFEITEVKHIPHPERAFYDLTILGIKDVDMTGYEPIATSPYPREGRALEMYSFLVNNVNFLDNQRYPLGKRTCTAGHFDATQGFGFNSCLISPTPAILGSPIVDAKRKRVVAVYSGQEEFGDPPVLTAYAAEVPTKLGDLDLEGYGIKVSSETVTTTWAQVKKQASLKQE